MDVDLLLSALDNEDNISLMNLTNKKIKETKIHILTDLNFSPQVLSDFINKLENYRYIDAMNELNYGSYIRWINISNIEKLSLAKGGIFCDLSITDNGVYIVCKGFTHTHFKIKMDECLIFQKLKPQEQILLTALDHLQDDH